MNATNRLASWSRAFLLLAALVALGCGGSTGNVVTGGAPTDTSGTGNLVFNFLRAQAPMTVPLSTSRLRFQFYTSADGEGTPVKTETRTFAPTITIDGVPVAVQSVRVTALGPDEVPLTELVALTVVLDGQSNSVILGAGRPISLSSLSVTPTTADVAVGGSRSFTANATYSNGDIIAAVGAVWSSNDAAVATVEASSGVATGARRGTTQISASLDGQSGTATLTVAGGAALRTLVVAPDDTRVSEGATQQYSVTGQDQNGAPLEVTDVVWSATGDATINATTGLAVAARTNNREGTAIITARVGEVSDSTTLTILGIPGTLRTIVTTPGTLNLTLGGATGQFSSTGSFSNAADAVLTNAAHGLQYTSANPNVATMDNNGVVTAVGAGSTTITASAQNVTGNTVNVTVGIPGPFTANPVLVLAGNNGNLLIDGSKFTPFDTSTVTDDQADLGGGRLTLDVTGGTEDLTISINGALPGVAPSSTGNGSSLVVVDLTNAATPAAIQTILRTTVVSATTAGQRTVTVTLTDGLGGVATASLTLQALRLGRMYIANYDDGTVEGFQGARTGTPTSATIITGLTGPEGLAIDEARDRLYVACNNGTVQVFNNASTITPQTRVDNAVATISGFTVATGIYYDAASDRLYVSDFGNVRVFNSASGLSGTIVLPAEVDQTLSGYTNQVQGIALDLVNVANPNDDRLFVGGPTALDVYEASSSKDGPRSTEADKTVEGAATQLSPAIWGLALDPGRQILYVACTASVVVFASPTDPPSTIDGNEDPTRRLTGIGGPLGWLVVDPAFDVLYSTRGNGGGDTGVRVYNNASSLTGALTPDRTVGTSIRIFGFCIDFSRD